MRMSLSILNLMYQSFVSAMELRGFWFYAQTDAVFSRLPTKIWAGLLADFDHKNVPAVSGIYPKVKIPAIPRPHRRCGYKWLVPHCGNGWMS